MEKKNLIKLSVIIILLLLFLFSTIQTIHAVPIAYMVYLPLINKEIIVVPTSTPTPTPTSKPPSPTQTQASNCDPSYPTVCIPPPPPDLDCGDITFRRFTVLPPDPHNFDSDKDGIGCET
jgi:hypothetical protein